MYSKTYEFRQLVTDARFRTVHSAMLTPISVPNPADSLEASGVLRNRQVETVDH